VFVSFENGIEALGIQVKQVLNDNKWRGVCGSRKTSLKLSNLSKQSWGEVSPEPEYSHF